LKQIIRTERFDLTKFSSAVNFKLKSNQFNKHINNEHKKIKEI